MYTIKPYYPLDATTGEHDAMPEHHVVDSDGTTVAKADGYQDALAEIDRLDSIERAEAFELHVSSVSITHFDPYDNGALEGMVEVCNSRGSFYLHFGLDTDRYLAITELNLFLPADADNAEFFDIYDVNFEDDITQITRVERCVRDCVAAMTGFEADWE